MSTYRGAGVDEGFNPEGWGFMSHVKAKVKILCVVLSDITLRTSRNWHHVTDDASKVSHVMLCLF